MDRFNPERLTAQANVAMVVQPDGKYVRWEDAERLHTEWSETRDELRRQLAEAEARERPLWAEVTRLEELSQECAMQHHECSRERDELKDQLERYQNAAALMTERRNQFAKLLEEARGYLHDAPKTGQDLGERIDDALRT